MPNLEVRVAEARDADACAALLAARHRRDRERVWHLAAALEAPSACRPAIDDLLASPRADGVVAIDAGEVRGFLFGERMLLPPGDFASLFVPPHSIAMPIQGHAVAEPSAAPIMYRAMYAQLAETWTGAGLFTHRVSIPPGDADMQEAWVALGFGRYLTAATRPPAQPVHNPRPRALSIERASPEDLDDVMALADDLNAWHWRSPMFWPVVHTAEPAAREFTLDQLRSGESPFFVAYEEGRPVGMQTFMRPGFTPPVVDRENDVYLFEGVVADSARGGGIGATLLAHSMEWAARSGFQTCTLHFASGNPLGAPFWTGHDFAPVEHGMERTIDARVAWARPGDAVR